MFAGCSESVALRDQVGKVKGKITSGDGQAIKSVSLTFQPLDTGLPATFQVSESGDFEGEMHSGKYTYFVAKSSAKNSEASIKTVDAKFLEPHMERTIEIKPGTDVSIVLK
jgi:hypothetical protein